MDAPVIRYTRARDGTRIAYGLYAGSGVPVLHVPWPGSSPMPMAHEIPAVAACFDAICSGRPGVRFDWRGLGLSGAIGEWLTVAEQAMDMEAACEAVGQPLDVVAWCVASIPVVMLAVERPELFRTLTLAAPDYEGCDSHYSPFWAMRRNMLEVEWVEIGMRRGMDIPASGAHALAQRWVEFAPADAARAHMNAFLAGSLDGVLPALSVPTAILSYRGSREQSARVASAISHCNFRFVDELHTGRKAGLLLRQLIDELGPLAGQVEEPRAEGVTEAGASNVFTLSTRESEVLSLLVCGRTNAAIAEALTLSTRTVERHVQNIYTKLGVHNRVEAANWAREHGID